MFRTGFGITRKTREKTKERFFLENGVDKERFFLENGAAVLEKIISLHNGVCNPIRSYSFQQLKNATNGFLWEIHGDWNYQLHKGIHEDREIFVKKFTGYNATVERIANEIAMASRMSNHNNVLKLLGCCLEMELPLLVYEFTRNENLGSHIYRADDNQLTWKLKLRIATGTANAIAYLHRGLSKTIIHRDIKPTNIFLDENHAAKLFEFQEAIPIPEGETHVDVEVLFGTRGYFAPEVLIHKRHTEKSDVFAFGILLGDVLTGKRYNDLQLWYEEISNDNSSDSRVQPFDSLGFQSDDICSQEGENRESVSSNVQPNDISFGHMLQKYGRALEYYCENFCQDENRAQELECMKLVLRCVKMNPDERPDMIEVEKALRLIKTI